MSYICRLCRAIIMLFICLSAAVTTAEPVRLGIVGLKHGHAKLFFRLLNPEKVKVVGIAEEDPAVVELYAKQYKLDHSLLFENADEMLDVVKPEAVAAFTSTFDHLSVVQKCAPRGIDVMVEKPLAVSLDHACRMKELAEKHSIQLVTNYETTWHESLRHAYDLVVRQQTIGTPRKFVFHHGNYGTRRGHGVDFFIDWLTDPKLNGGGALTDFGCYGMTLATQFMKGEKPESVYAVARTYRPEQFPNVDDDATIILNYANAQCILQASWNWSIPRKDMEVYGEKGYVIADSSDQLRIKTSTRKPEQKKTFPPLGYPINQPFNYFVDLVRGKAVIEPFSPASIENNMIVMEILEAARRSIRSGKTIMLPE